MDSVCVRSCVYYVDVWDLFYLCDDHKLNIQVKAKVNIPLEVEELLQR